MIPAYTAAKPNAGTAYAPNVGSISGLAGQPFTRNGVLQNAIALTLTGLPTYDPTWSGYLIVAEFANGNRVTVTGIVDGHGQGNSTWTRLTASRTATSRTRCRWQSTATTTSSRTPLSPASLRPGRCSLERRGHTIPPVTTQPAVPMQIVCNITDDPLHQPERKPMVGKEA